VLILLVFRDASAQSLEQPGTDPTTTNSNLVSTETNTGQNPSSTPPQEELKAVTVTQPEAKAVTPERIEPDVNPCANIEVSGDTWLDQLHDYAERNICRPAVWFDHFFGDQRLLEDVRPGTFIKSRSAVRWTEGQKLKYLFDFHVQWQLPHWERYLRRIRIYYDSRSEATKFTTQPGQAIDPGLDPATGVSQPVVGARLDLYARLRSLVSIDSGVKLSIHPDAFIRIRYEFAKPFGEVYLIRFSQIPMWQAVEHFTDTTQLDFERTITTFSLVRWANNVTYTEGSNGVTWNTGFSFITQLTPKSAISYDTNMWGVNYPEWTVQNYRIGIKYRKNFYRPWFFFELEPEITWPRNASQKDYTGQRGNSVYAFLATLEIQFGQ